VKGVVDLIEAEPNPLRGADERHASQHVARVSPLVPAGPFSRDQADVLIEAKRRGGDT
jgi:hypothetical protein